MLSRLRTRAEHLKCISKSKQTGRECMGCAPSVGREPRARPLLFLLLSISCLSRFILVAHCWGCSKRDSIFAPLLILDLRGVKYCEALKLCHPFLGSVGPLGRGSRKNKCGTIYSCCCFHVVLYENTIEPPCAICRRCG